MTGVAPLTGIRVVELSDDVGLAFCGKYLAALGAEVTVAAPRSFGGALRDYLDHGKHTAAADTAAVEEADVVLLGRASAPGPRPARQIRVLSSDLGENGPRSDWQGTELTLQAAGGLLAVVGENDREPLQLGGHQVAYSLGTLAFTGVMTALAERDRSGEGQDVTLSGLETVAYLEWKGRVYQQAGSPLSRGDRSGPIVLRCADGHFGFYYRAQDWPHILEVFPDERLRAPEFATHPDRIAHGVLFKEALESVVGSLTKDELYARLQSVGVPAGPVCTPQDLITSPQYQARGLMVEGPGGQGVMPAVAVEFNGRRPQPAA
ncbi:CoA transferase [Streptomyces sp. NPDC046805]|uniref:CoA transferase n=1 Tax=Streptomyces sp. NPDC046805 TaxID=3155134 RepID=UPI0033E5DF8A